MQIGSTGFNAEEEFRPQRRKRLLSAYDVVKPARPAAPASRASRRGKVTGFTLGGGAATEDESAASVRLGDTLPAEDTQRIAESFLTPEGRQETQTQKRMRDTTTIEGFMAAFDKVRVGRLTRGEEGNDPARQTAIDRARQRIKDGIGLDSEWVRNELRMLTQAQTDKAVDESLSAPFGPTEIGKLDAETDEPGPVTRFLSEAGQNLGKDVVRGYTTLVKGGAQLLGQPTAGITSEGFEETPGGQTAKGVAQAVPFFTPGLGQVSAAEGVFSGALDLASGRGLWKAVNQVVPVEMALKTFDPKATTEERAAGLTALALLGHTAMKSGGRAARSVSEGLGTVADRLKAASEPEARIFGEQLGKAVEADPAKFDEAASVIPGQQADDLLKTVTKDAEAKAVPEVSPIPTRPGTPEAPPTTAGPLLEAGKVQERPNLSTPDEGTIRPDAGAPGQQEGVRGGGEVPPGVVSGRVLSASEAPRPAGPPEGIAHADTAAWRKEAGLDPYVKTRYKVNDYSQEAVDRGHADNALSIADQVNSGQKTSADRFEQEGLRLGFHKVKLELKDIEAAKSDAIEAGDHAALAEAETAYQDAMGRGDRITKALDKVGSEAGGTLGGRAYDLIDEGDSLDLRRKVQSTTGEKVSAKDQARLNEVAAKVKALEAEVDRLTKLTSDPNRILRQPSRGGKANLTGRAGRVSQADFQAAKEKLLTVVKPGALGSGFGGFEVNWTPEHYAALKTAVRYVVQNTPGLRNLEQPYEGLKSKVQEMFGDIPDHLLRQAVVDELGSPRAVTREQMTARAKENAARRQARRAVTEIVEEAKDRQRTTAQKAAREIAGVLSIPRRMMTFLDDSAVGRQGLFLATTHPQAAAKALVRQWEVVKKDGFDTVMGRIETDPLYHEFRGAGGYLADPLNGVREEGFVHSFLDKIPGLNKAMQGSEELMAAYLNVLRFESYKALRNGLSIGGHEPTVPELKWAAGMVNVASGRGIGPGEGGKASRVANQFFFSPQLLVARMRMATGEQAVQGFRASGRAGALATAEYAKYLAARAALATLMAASGGKTETDVKDKEFGQTRFGKLKVDTSGGMDASAGLVWGTVAQALDRQPARYGKGVVDRAGRFLGNRLSPVAGYVRGAVDKKDFKGDPFQPGREAVKMLAPIHIVNQIDGSLTKEGATAADRTKMIVLEVFGFSTSFYDRSASSKGPASPPKPSKPPSPPKPGLSRHRRKP